MYAKQDQGTLTRNFVRQMAKQFEQIEKIKIDSTSYVNSHEANFKQCNWWLDMPSSVTCFDDPPTENGNESQVHKNLVENHVPLAIDRAEIANELQNAHTPDNDDSEKKIFFNKIDKCLSIPPKSPDENAKNR